VGLEQRLGVEDVGDRLGECRCLVTLALARPWRRAWSRWRGRGPLVQRYDGADAFGEQRLAGTLLDSGGRSLRGEGFFVPAMLGEPRAQRRELAPRRRLRRALHRRPRSANETTVPWPTTR